MEKQKIQITKVLEPFKMDSGGKIYKYLAKFLDKEGNPVGAETEIETFDEAFAEILKVGFKGEADIEEKPKKNGAGNNLIIKQVYADGNPVKEKSKSWKAPDDSPEKRLSIERQSYMENLPGVAVCKEIPDDLREAIFQWGRELFNVKHQKKQEETAKTTEVHKKTEELFPDDIITPEMNTLGDYTSIMESEFKLNNAEARQLLAGKKVCPAAFREAYLKALAEKKAK